MDTEFHTLPPLKRFRLMQQQEQQHDLNQSDSSHLPAKKRKEARNLNPPLQPTPSVYLPAKKRIWALHPDLIDLNVEYKPPPPEIPPKQISQIESLPKPISQIESLPNPLPQIKSPQNANPQIEDDEDGIVCAVCDSTDADSSDPIVFCDGCDLMVHSFCYGSPLTESIPDGDWFCAKCLSDNKGETFICSLCPNSGGAMKPTKDDKWAHIVCALLVPEVFFANSKEREGIDCSRVPKRRYEQCCYICKSSNGCAIDCSEPNCDLSFHVSCGFSEDLCIEYRDGGKKRMGVVAAFCKEHTELWNKQQQTGKYKIVAREESKK